MLAPAEVHIVIETAFGPIEATLDDQRAPISVRNFLRYVDARHYDGGQFHRTVRTKPDNQPGSAVKIDVVQAGVSPQHAKQSFPPVMLERTNRTGLQHLDGTLSMARMEADSATNGFFICIGNQPSLDFGGNRNPDLQGFAAFGKVTAGMDVVRRIHQSPSGPTPGGAGVALGNQSLTPPIRILNIRRK
ncbi:MAG: peptidylprolyl isomerase [Bryobacterales bacterium]|nr:peptidylprolyl isomerase [Bryobacterales bacterium]